MNFQLSSEVDNKKVFLLNSSELEERFDCEYYRPAIIESINVIKQKPHVKLGDKLKKIQTGYNNKQNSVIGVPFIRTQNIRPVWLDLVNTSFTTDEQVRESQAGDLLFTRIGVNVGDVSFNSSGTFAISDNVILVRTSDPNFAKFVSIFLSTELGSVFIGREKRDTARAIISYGNIKKILIPVLSNDNQNKAVAKIDAAYASKKQKEAEAQALLDSIDGYLLGELGIELPKQEENTIQSRIFTRTLSEVSGSRFDPDYYRKHYYILVEALVSGMFECVAMKNATSLVSSGNTPASSEYSDEPTDYPIIKVASYKGEFISLDKLGYSKLPKQLKAQKNDIFVLSAAHQASYVGRFLKFLNCDPIENTSYVGELICIRAEETICNPMYLFSLLNTEPYKVLLNREKRGQTSHIYSQDIKHIKVPLPPLEKQNEIASHIDGVRQRAKQLKHEAQVGLKQAKKEVEAMILGTS